MVAVILTITEWLVTSPKFPTQRHVSRGMASRLAHCAPVAFLGRSSDKAASQKAPSTAQTPGITFAPEVGTPEHRNSPDPDAEPILSQTFQRLARRFSVTTPRTGTVSDIPILGNPG
jgi:hypothetical protein